MLREHYAVLFFLKGCRDFLCSEKRSYLSILKDLQHTWVVSPVGFRNLKQVDQHLFLQSVECCAAEQEMTVVIEVNNPLQLELLLVNSEASSELAKESICFIYDNQVKII